MALTAASLVVADPVTDAGRPTYLRGAPSAYVIDVGDDDLEGMVEDLILGPQIGPVHVIPLVYDWTVWSLATLAPIGLYYVGGRLLRSRG
jgi:hypothetical protein